MSEAVRAQVEQIALGNLLDNAIDAFQKGMLSIDARIILWGSLVDDGQILRQLLERKDKAHLLDRRRRLGREDAKYLDHLELAAGQLIDYVAWIRSHNAQPVAREALVTYCALFENCLKAIAVTFRLAQKSPTDGLGTQTYVPGPDLTAAYHAIDEAWHVAKRNAADDEPALKAFYDREIKAKNPAPAEFRLIDLEAGVWEDCASAFKLRNAIVHSLARPRTQIEIGDRRFAPTWEIELSAGDLREVESAFAQVVTPFTMMARI